MLCIALAMVTRKPITKRARRTPLKPFAQGTPEADSGEPVVTTLVCFLYLHTRGVRKTPGIPCALIISRAKFNSSGAIASREGGGVSGAPLHAVVPALVRNFALARGPITTGLRCDAKAIDQRV
jgi:hypothetical protein